MKKLKRPENSRIKVIVETAIKMGLLMLLEEVIDINLSKISND
ncbi:MAG: hypothetical protein R2837_05495 [Aliarcobacter sp.]